MVASQHARPQAQSQHCGNRAESGLGLSQELYKLFDFAGRSMRGFVLLRH